MRPVATLVHGLVLLLALALAACETAPPRPEDKGAAVVQKPAPKPSPPAPKPAPAPLPREPEPAPAPLPRAVEELRRGLQRYDDGEYKEAARHIQRALDAGLANPADEANARKHLAFMACVAKRTSVCRAEFRKAFAADPAFALAPAEVGHPMWGPVYKSVQAEVAKKRTPAPPEPRR